MTTMQEYSDIVKSPIVVTKMTGKFLAEIKGASYSTKDKKRSKFEELRGEGETSEGAINNLGDRIRGKTMKLRGEKFNTPFFIEKLQETS